jgi:hypothetical protein
VTGWLPGAITDDQLWCQALKVNKRYVTGGGPSLEGTSLEERRLHKLIWLGITNGGSNNKHWESSTRAMQHTSVVADQLLTMLKEEHTKVGLVFLHFGGKI